MKKFVIITDFLFFIILVILLSEAINGEVIEDEKSQKDPIIEKIREAMELSYQMDRERSEKVFDEAINKWPDDPEPYLFKGGLYLNMFQNLNNTTEEEVERLKEKILFFNNKAIEVAHKQIKTNPDDEGAQYCLGGATGNIGRFYILNGQMWKAFWKGKKGYKILKKIVDKDEEYHDAYLGLGIYNYFSAIMPKFVKALSFLLGGTTGDKDEGIRQLELVRDNSSLLSVEARKILLRTYRGEEDWDGFYHNSKWLAEHYPENIYFQVPYVYGLTQNKQISDAKNHLNSVNAMLQNDPSRLARDMRVKYCRYVGLLHYKLGDYAKSEQSYMKALELSRDVFPPTRIWGEDYYYLAASNARLEREKEAFKYLRKAIDKEWKIDNLENLPEWKPYKQNREFLLIIGKIDN
ncbi:tetratricopeptide repeat protein [Candidatus Scalindua japonica]|uniref:Tetratricopeptide repeat protein n=1 Tax=Candidatus Scalindua japonica TaxID=1284222 RepID=A0A286TTU7_9BACT|nr:tetratricopeptide repeat protein [Candidatus Scalindua japonica]GAX59294.1 tetratricopeptide repeat protein [Candidatus Scalindua japonica]